jgi:hypothetical protein
MEQFRDREIRRRSALNAEQSQRDKTDALLRDLGADDVLIETVTVRIDDEDVQTRVEKLRAFAKENPGVVLGALSALIAGGAVAAGAAVAKKKSAKKRIRAAAARKSSKKSGSKTASRKASKKRSTSAKRTLMEPHPGDKRYVRRDAKGRIKESVDVGRSLSADRRRRSKTKAKSGSGDKGDR